MESGKSVCKPLYVKQLVYLFPVQVNILMSDEDPNVDNVKKVVIPPSVKVCLAVYTSWQDFLRRN